MRGDLIVVDLRFLAAQPVPETASINNCLLSQTNLLQPPRRRQVLGIALGKYAPQAGLLKSITQHLRRGLGGVAFTPFAPMDGIPQKGFVIARAADGQTNQANKAQTVPQHHGQRELLARLPGRLGLGLGEKLARLGRRHFRARPIALHFRVRVDLAQGFEVSLDELAQEEPFGERSH